MCTQPLFTSTFKNIYVKISSHKGVQLKKIAIIGAGASGLVAGIEALKNNHHVTIYEKNSKVGRKLLATGNGRCNITNENIEISHYHSSNKDFVKKIIGDFGFNDCKKYFEDLGLNLTKNEKGRCYPLSLQASNVVEVLEYTFLKSGGNLKLEHEVRKVKKSKAGFLIDEEYFDKLLIASGSCAMKKLGASESGYEFAKSFSHEITPLVPSLVQLVTEENVSEFAGVKFESEVTLKVQNSQIQKVTNDLLLAKYGLSGTAVLDISRQANLALKKRKNVSVGVDCLPKYSSKILLNMLEKNANLPPLLLLNSVINKKLAKLILKRAKIPSHEKNLNQKKLIGIAECIKNLKFNIIDSKGFEYAEVVSGGVNVNDIYPKTMESKLTKNLFFCGEVLDVDGDCGGYNLHFAWASGIKAGQNI